MNLGMLRGFGGSVRGYRRGPVTGVLATYPQFSSMSTVAQAANAVTVLSGLTTAGVANLRRALRVNGRGCINFAAIYANDATPRDVRMVIQIDGRRFINTTATGVNAGGKGIMPIGSNSGSLGVAFQPEEFQRELIVYFGCSLGETDKLTIAYNVDTWAP